MPSPTKPLDPLIIIDWGEEIEKYLIYTPAEMTLNQMKRAFLNFLN